MKPVPASTPLVIGLIGGIGSGKSLAASYLARTKGAVVISADRWGHEALRQPRIMRAIKKQWPSAVVGTSRPRVIRRRLADLVFASRKNLSFLNRLVHPWMRAAIKRQLAQAARREKSLFVLDAALLPEMQLAALCHKIIFVDAPQKERIRRVAVSRGWNVEEVKRRERFSWPLARKRKRADKIIVNRGSPSRLFRQIEKIYNLTMSGGQTAGSGQRKSRRNTTFPEMII